VWTKQATNRSKEAAREERKAQPERNFWQRRVLSLTQENEFGQARSQTMNTMAAETSSDGAYK
jgi:hypothetical protein